MQFVFILVAWVTVTGGSAVVINEYQTEKECLEQSQKFKDIQVKCKKIERKN